MLRHPIYDYVIVGAGSAGCVLANRLSEDPQRHVLLIEAGGSDRAAAIHIPAAFSKLFKTRDDWAYYTEEQPALNGRRLYWPRGKVVGGSSSINAMIYTRADPREHDRWRDAGNAGWGFEDVADYYRKAESGHARSNEAGLHVSHQRDINPLSRVFVTAAVNAGVAGAGFFDVTQRRGRRHSSADAYLRPVRRRPNLTVRLGTHVSHVVFEGRRAAGVALVQNGGAVMRAAREVILCAGAVNSPQLLMLSGIGAVRALDPLGIRVVVDLPGVGLNLRDHLVAVVTCRCTRPITLASAGGVRDFLVYLAMGRGPLTSPVAEAGAFVKTRPDLPYADLEFGFAPAFFMNHGFANPAGHGFTAGAVLLQPESHGHIRLRSRNPLDPPLIDPGYLTHESDARVLVKGLMLARRLIQDRAFDPYRGPEIWPGPDVRTEEDFVQFIRRTAETLYHPMGTCRMGSDAAAVVDSELRVHGTDGLRVVDASIIPTAISCHPHAVVVMIAEKAADLISAGSAKDARPARPDSWYRVSSGEALR